MVSSAQRAAIKRYDARNMTRRVVQFGPNDAKTLEWLDAQPNKSGYIKALIRADMERREKTS